MMEQYSEKLAAPMQFIPAKTILSGYTGTNSWFGCNYNMNIYKGCCHGCIYCDSRSECYRVENFDEVRAKENALELLACELRSKRRGGVIGTGAMSDPYNPFEREYRLTRGALKLIEANRRFGVSIATKSDLVVRDVDVLTAINRHAPVLVKLTITTAADELCAKIEPNVAKSSKRFAALEQLAVNGIFAGILLMPVLPFLEDNEENIMAIIKRAWESGAKFIYPAFGVTLRLNQRAWYYRKLDEKFPGLKQKYIEQFGNSYSCSSPHAGKLLQIFRCECDRYGLMYKMDEIISGYKSRCDEGQLSLF